MIHPAEAGTNPLIAPAKDFRNVRTPSVEKESGPLTERISISEETKSGDISLTDALREEFRQIFQLGSERTDPFIAHLDRIASEAGI